MPSTSPGTSVKKPDPNIKSMYLVSVESHLVLGLSSAGAAWLGLEGRDSWCLGCFPSQEGLLSTCLSQEGLRVGRGQDLFLC